MWMTDHVREVKRQLRDVYGLVPDRVVDGEPCFDRVPDGIYPMTVGGRREYTVVSDNGFIMCLEIKTPPGPANT